MSARHQHGWRNWQRACPRCRQHRKSAFVAIGTAVITAGLLGMSFVTGNYAASPSAAVAAVQPVQAAQPVGDPGSLHQLAAATTRLVASQTAVLTPHQRHLAHLAHLARLLSWQAPAAVPVPPRVTGTSLNARLLAEAETMAGTPYVFGGAAPGGFDCSGLVYWAAGQLGIRLPRDTFGMLAAVGSVLIPVGSPSPGDLAFFGSGHVELYVSPGVFFGAQQTGTLVGLHDYGGYYSPTGYYAVA